MRKALEKTCLKVDGIDSLALAFYMLNMDKSDTPFEKIEVHANNYEKFLRESMKILDCLCMTDFYGKKKDFGFNFFLIFRKYNIKFGKNLHS